MKTILSNYTATLLSLVMIAVFAIAMGSLYSCKKAPEPEVQQNFPFELTVMPLPTEIFVGTKVEIRIKLKRGGNFTGAQYFLRYFQKSGTGKLQFPDKEPFVPNDLYRTGPDEIRLHYEAGGTTDHEFDVWISDNFENEQKLNFKFRHRTWRDGQG